MPRRLLLNPGDRHGRLVAISDTGRKYATTKQSLWRFRCDCGTEKELPAHRVVHEVIRSCGCLHRETTAAIHCSHKSTKTALYRSWRSMHCRCRTPRQQNYRYYGGKGIRVCERWSGPQGFENFRADMGEHPGEGWSIDRIDSAKDYEPGNCRWLPMLENVRRMHVEKKRRNLVRTHCRRGHEFTPENSYYRKTGARICVACNKLHAETSKQRRKEQTAA